MVANTHNVVDIYLRPQALNLSDHTSITIGDLHANAIKLLYNLVRYGICKISDKKYQRLVAIYKNTQRYYVAPLSDIDKYNLTLLLREFDALIDNLIVTNPCILVRLIGDECADRGLNDYFVLKILHKLHAHKVPISILFSNHGADFIEAYECYQQRKKFFGTTIFPKQFASSLYHLAFLLEHNIISFNELNEMINECYKPNLKLIDYSIDLRKNEITIYSHAAIGFQELALLATKMQVLFHDATARDLAKTIDHINQRYQKKYVQKNCVNTLYSHRDFDITGPQAYQMPAPNSDEKIDRKETSTLDNIVSFCAWNRDYNHLQRPMTHRGYSLRFVRGHDPHEDNPSKHCINLDKDNTLGKATQLHQGYDTTLLSKDRIASSLQLKVLSNSMTCLFNLSFRYFFPVALFGASTWYYLSKNNTYQRNLLTFFSSVTSTDSTMDIISGNTPRITSH